MMDALIAIAGACAGIAVVALIRHLRKITPDTMLIATKSNAKRWQKFSGCVRDAQEEGYTFGADQRNEIIDLHTMKKTGRYIVNLKKK